MEIQQLNGIEFQLSVFSEVSLTVQSLGHIFVEYMEKTRRSIVLMDDIWHLLDTRLKLTVKFK